MLHFIVMRTGVYKTALSNSKSQGFTLIEILVVITLLAILATIIVNSYVSTLKKGRDSRRKQDLEQVSRALELYYADNNVYPATLSWDSPLVNSQVVPTKLYMKRLPSDPANTDTLEYLYETDGTYYRLFTCLENDQDANYQIYSGKNCGSGCNNCNYGIASPNQTVE